MNHINQVKLQWLQNRKPLYESIALRAVIVSIDHSSANTANSASEWF